MIATVNVVTTGCGREYHLALEPRNQLPDPVFSANRQKARFFEYHATRQRIFAPSSAMPMPVMPSFNGQQLTPAESHRQTGPEEGSRIHCPRYDEEEEVKPDFQGGVSAVQGRKSTSWHEKIHEWQ